MTTTVHTTIKVQVRTATPDERAAVRSVRSPDAPGRRRAGSVTGVVYRHVADVPTFRMPDADRVRVINDLCDAKKADPDALFVHMFSAGCMHDIYVVPSDWESTISPTSADVARSIGTRAWL